MLANGYWVLGNRQMFSNDHGPKDISTGEMNDPKHNLTDLHYHIAPILIVFPILWFYKFYIKHVSKFLVYIGCFKPHKHLDAFKNNTIAVNEGLGTYWECINGLD